MRGDNRQPYTTVGQKSVSLNLLLIELIQVLSVRYNIANYSLLLQMFEILMAVILTR